MNILKFLSSVPFVKEPFLTDNKIVISKNDSIFQ